MKSFFLLTISLIIFNISFSQNDTLPSVQKFGDEDYYEIQLQKQNVIFEKLPEPELKIFNSWWQNLLFIFYLSILAFFYTKFNSEINSIFKAFFNKSAFNRLNIAQNNIFNNILIVFNFLFFILVTTLFFRILQKLTPYNTYSKAILFSSIFTIIFIFYHIKLLSAGVWVYIFEDKTFFKDFYINLRIANFIQSIILLFVLFITTYNINIKENLIELSFLMILIVFIIRVFNILREFFSKGFLFLYLILYLCTVEILPVLLVYKYLLIGLQ